MEVISTREEMRELHEGWRHHDEHVALVPTMGNLHAGEDFEEYPRTLKRDAQHVKKLDADVLFTPDVDVVYPFGIDKATLVSVPGLTRNFCGASRPGHFDGVTTVVARLFALVQPDAAVFGQKDYQQQLVIRHMTADLSLPIRIITAPTVREPDGLAMSSRNQYLSESERVVAPQLHEVRSQELLDAYEQRPWV